MTEPLSNKPKVKKDDILLGYVNRYFVQNISTKKITEVDNRQYDIIKRDRNYTVLTIKWIITGEAYSTIASDGTLITGAYQQNLTTIEWYTKQMPGLYRMLKNPFEFFSGAVSLPKPTVSTEVAPPLPTFTVTHRIVPVSTTTTTTTTTAPPILTVYDVVSSTFEPIPTYNPSTGMDGIIENVEPMNIVVNQPFFYTPA